MNINEFFDPVSLPKPDENFYPEDFYLSKNIFVHTANNPIGNLDNFQLAILGVGNENSNSEKGCAQGPNSIREKLYLLRNISENYQIIDLGNLKSGKTRKDTYFGLQEVLRDLLNHNLSVLILGGGQDLDLGSFMAFQKMNKKINMTTIDASIDYAPQYEFLSNFNYLNNIIGQPGLNHFANIGHQLYFVDPEKINRLQEQFFTFMRIGQVRSDLLEVEPIIRDSHIISFDLSSIRQADAPGTHHPSPNGFYGEEACQLAKFAGLSNRNRVFGIYEIHPDRDINFQTAHLGAQMAWYYMEGNSIKNLEDPVIDRENFTEFIIGNKNDEMKFYKSMKSNRWWALIPEKDGKDYYMACTQNDYERASRNDIPERWLRFFRKLND